MEKRPLSLIVLLFTCLIGFLCVGQVRAQSAKGASTIAEVVVRGSQNVDESRILSAARLRVGEEASVETVRRALRAVSDMGYFSDVRLEAEDVRNGVRLTIQVVEKPKLLTLSVIGNKKFKTSEIQEKLDLRPGITLVDAQTVWEAKQKLLVLYHEKGYYNAAVSDSFRVTGEGATLTLKIAEGEKARIKKIEIQGNRALSERQVLAAMKTKKRGWRWAFKVLPAFSAGGYQADTLKDDLDRIVYAYKRQGYIDAEVRLDSISYNSKKDRMILHVSVTEGMPYNVGQVAFVGDSLLDTTYLRGLTKLSPGRRFDQGKFDKTLEAFSAAYYDRGYIYAHIEPDLVPNQQVLDLTYRIQEGKPAHVRKINIVGNNRTREKIIRRELQIHPGDLFRRNAIMRSQRQVYFLNFFDDVMPVPGDRDTTTGNLDLNFQVKEKVTGQFQVGTTYDAINKFTGNFEVTQPNLFGRAQVVSLKYQFGKNIQNIDLGFTEPWFRDSPTSVGADIFRTTQTVNYWEELRGGGTLRLARPLAWPDYTRLYWQYSLEQIRLTISDTSGLSSTVLADQGKHLASTTGFTLTRDARDAPFGASNGTYNSLSTEWSGGDLLRGTVQYQKYIYESRWYHPVFWKTAIMFRVRGGVVDGYKDPNTVPVYERFYPGGTGDDGIRGYDDRSIGPFDPVNNVNLGGRELLILTTEYHIKFTNSAYGILLGDAGNTWNERRDVKLKSLYRGAGVGVRAEVPMLGLLGFDYAYGFDRINGKVKGWTPHFQLGTSF
jgi:outer membrane protein insertion porin family